MKNTALILALTIPFGAYAADDSIPTPESMTSAQVLSTQGSETYSYVRCWYRTDASHDSAATDWKWAKKENGDDYTINGYWWSSVSFKNMFYSDTPQSEIKHRCEQTLGIQHDAADITYFAADNRFSYNHSIWTNDNAMCKPIPLIALSLLVIASLTLGTYLMAPNGFSQMQTHGF